MALSPWPTTPAAADTAVARLKELLGLTESVGGDARLKQIAAAVSARIELYAPGAPDALRDEAVVRGVAYLLDVGSGAETRRRIGDESLTLSSPAAWFHRSGAYSVLSQYRDIRAGVVA
ncbi:MAG: hypothetical protein OXI46_01445 [Gemmatimonadota bacterium]|nr:hypothetical protein [Gemmatimonadota bacterium]